MKYDELIKSLRNCAYCKPCITCKYYGEDRCTAKIMKEAANAIEELSVIVRAQKAVLDKFTAADVRPVIHGKWIRRESRSGDSWYECSECGELALYCMDLPEPEFSSYCPHCGAIIDTVEVE